ncbi:MAG: hypothetical protein M1820_007931 [Bogoriella megaspora]|nr:MAG: hypothetical protein M1820_007931 [Bogoriella megaspora]
MSQGTPGMLDGYELPKGARPTRERKLSYGAAKEPRTRPSKLRELVLKSRHLFYRYDKLKPDQVRLLFLEPATEIDAEIYVEVHTVNLEYLKNNRTWQALSYHWGDRQESEPVYVRNALRSIPQALEFTLAAGIHKDDAPDDSGPLMPFIHTKSNLYSALKHIRQIGTPDRTGKIPLWVDAICINQTDKIEKTKQVAMMAKIYAAAGRVCIWLGSRDSHGRRVDAMNFVQEIVQDWNPEKLICDQKAQRWINFVFLLRSSWFSRRWVIQELALAEDATARCDSYEVHWKDFADAIGFSSFYLGDIKEVARKVGGKLSDDERADLKALTDLDTPQAVRLVDEIANAFRKHPSGKLLEPAKELETLVSTLTAFDSSDPRDTIFALLNIARETSSMSIAPRRNISPLQPDYTQDALRIYVIKSTGSLDIICRQWALPEDQQSNSVTLPSWINLRPTAKKNAKSFVGLPGSRYYNASRNEKPEVTFGINTIKGKGRTNAGLQPGFREDRARNHLDTQTAVEANSTSISKRIHSASEDTQQSDRNAKRAKHRLSEMSISAENNTAQPSGLERQVGPQGAIELTIEDSVAAVQNTPTGLPGVFPKSSFDLEDLNEGKVNTSQVSPAQLKSQLSEAAVEAPAQAIDSESTDTQSIRAPDSILKSLMFAKGLILGTIQWVVYFPDGVITQTALEKLGWKSDKGAISHDDLPDKVWRTLVADRDPNGNQPPNWYHKVCLKCLTQETPNGHMALKEMLRDEAANRGTMKREFLERVEAATWERTIIAIDKEESEPDQLVGLGPKNTESGDIICILFGCSVPCILRRRARNDGENLSYNFIGEAFVYGKMEGQALEKYDTGEEKAMTFQIV